MADTRFLLNDRQISTTQPRGLLVLDYLRHHERQTGTKEGCKEGDCGACTVLIGELDGAELDVIRYRPVTSCLMPVGELEGRHLVTIEGLNLPELTPVQQAIVDQGASQCGFCTPGIVVSLTGLLMQEGTKVDRTKVKHALSGHLCRCTGYRSLKAAGDIAADTVGERTGVESLVADGRLPAFFLDAPAQLRQIHAETAAEADGDAFDATSEEIGPGVVIAGGTDIYVQQGEDVPDAKVAVLNKTSELRQAMRGIERRNGHLRIGALTTFEEFAEHPEVRKRIPDIADYMYLIASWQIRNRATLGGNVVNASPIGDMTVLLLALGSELVLRRGDAQRTVPMNAFYQGYKRFDKTPDEILISILIPELDATTRVGWEKVSKRKCLDIATVNCAARIRAEGGRFVEVGLAVGGVAPIPLELKATNDFLRGQPIDRSVVECALAVAQTEITPISDVRGSADYKRLLTCQLMIALLTGMFPEHLTAAEFLGPASRSSPPAPDVGAGRA